VGAKLVASKDVTNTFSVFSGAGGVYTLIVPTGTYSLGAFAYGYLSEQRSGVTVTLHATNTQNFVLTAAPNYLISGVVTTA